MAKHQSIEVTNMSMYTYLTRYPNSLLRELINGYATCIELGIPESRLQEAIEEAHKLLFDRGVAD